MKNDMDKEKLEKAGLISGKINTLKYAIEYLNGKEDAANEFFLRFACKDNKDRIIAVFQEELERQEKEFMDL